MFSATFLCSILNWQSDNSLNHFRLCSYGASLFFGGTTVTNLKGILAWVTIWDRWSVVDWSVRGSLECDWRWPVSIVAFVIKDLLVDDDDPVSEVFVESCALWITGGCDRSMFASFGLVTVLRLELNRLLGLCILDWTRFFSSSRTTNSLYVPLLLLLDPSRLNAESF